TYGDADPALTFTYVGLVNGDAAASFTGALTRAAGEAAGTYAVTQNTLAATGNYTIGTFTPGTLAIDKKALTITADDRSRPYGQANPGLTYTPTGFVNGDTAAALSGAPALATAAAPGSPVGS